MAKIQTLPRNVASRLSGKILYPLGLALFVLIGFACSSTQKAGPAAVKAEPPPTAVYWNKAPLQPNAYAPLPLGSIKPRGWLKRQLEIQASGLSGHVDEFWPDLKNSGWIGGTGESWERAPYFLDGLVPLAYTLGDQRLIEKAKKWVNWTLEHQRADGRLGPELGKGKYATHWQESDEWWPNMIVLKFLTQYQEATGDPRVIPVIDKYIGYQSALLDKSPLKEWAQHRWADQVLTMVWLYNRTGNTKALDLARKLHEQSFDWNAHFADFKYTKKVSGKAEINLHSHGVNNAMAMKTAAVWWQVSGDEADRKAAAIAQERLDQYHGQANGIFSCDEHYAGLDPSQGTELCTVVEAMYSLEQLTAILGDAAYGDRLEKITFNALPATFKKDMWAHQYDQQVNQVMCSPTQRAWTSNGPESNLFGLEPNFGCCTANMHQGWPKFTANLWMATREGGLVAAAYAPSQVSAKGANGVDVVIVEDTEYPFRNTVKLTVYPASPAKFPLVLRVPAWANGTTITVQGEAQSGVKAGTYYAVDREWKSGDTVELTFPTNLKVTRWYRDGVAINRGPLVFSLAMGEEWKKVKGEEPHADWEVHPTTPWNYALVLDPANPAASLTVEDRPIGDAAFSPEGAPLRMKAKGRKVPEWTLVKGSAGPLPQSPVKTSAPEEELTLIPYGCTNLRVTVFPLAAP